MTVKDTPKHTPKHTPRSPLADLLKLKPAPEAAAALRNRKDRIVRTWAERVVRAIPSLKKMPYHELIDSVPNILARIADVLDCPDARQAQRLVEESPMQGLARTTTCGRWCRRTGCCGRR